MNAGVTGYPDRRERRRRPRRLVLVIALALAGVIAATLLVAFGAEAVVARASCTDHPVVVNLAAADEVAPAIEHVSKWFNKQRKDVNGHCAVVHVVSEQPSTAAAEVSGLKSPSGHAGFDAWIPDSSLWVDVARSSPAGAPARPAHRHHGGQVPADDRDAPVRGRADASLRHRRWAGSSCSRSGSAAPPARSGCTWSSPTRRRVPPGWPRSSSFRGCFSTCSARPPRPWPRSPTSCSTSRSPGIPAATGRWPRWPAWPSRRGTSGRSPSPPSRRSRSSTGPTRRTRCLAATRCRAPPSWTTPT